MEESRVQANEIKRIYDVKLGYDCGVKIDDIERLIISNRKINTMKAIRIQTLVTHPDEKDLTLDQLSDLSNAIDEVITDMNLEGVTRGELVEVKT